MAVIYTETVNGTDYGFDFANERIEVEATADEVTADDLKLATRRAEASQDGICFPEVVETGNPIVLDPAAGVQTAQNVILLRTYRILSLKTNGVFSTTGGNIVNKVNGVDVFAANTQITYVNNVSEASTRVGASENDARLVRIEQLLRNRTIVNDVNGKQEIYDDTNSSVLFEAPIYEDDGVTPWDGTGPIVRRDRFE